MNNELFFKFTPDAVVKLLVKAEALQ